MKINQKKLKELNSIKDTQKAMDFILAHDPLNIITIKKERNQWKIKKHS
tara:strand:+ start:471 stop:617 length:147 start_codon:yes stop_codon:yes gene_type:complete